MNFSEKATLGRTGLKAGRLGVTGNYGVSSGAMEQAFDRGCTYFNLGYMISGRTAGVMTCLKNIINKGKRDELILGIFSYSHSKVITDLMMHKRLKKLGTDYADVLVLGYYMRMIPSRILEGALKLKEKGIIRYIGVSGHNRKLFPELEKEGIFDVFHLRYNAAHRGAEQDVFPFLDSSNPPGIVNFTATRWGQLLDPKKIPGGEKIPTAVDCYRFVLTNPSVDVCMTGTRTDEQLYENLRLLETGPMDDEEMAWMRRVGDYVYGRQG
jgi:aryl-alcohol dehydrogenase-like predicted oxidoreductase